MAAHLRQLPRWRARGKTAHGAGRSTFPGRRRSWNVTTSTQRDTVANESSPKGGSDDQATVAGGVPVYKINKQARPAVLRLVKGPGAPKDYVLDLEEVIVGRSQDAHIIIDSESVSRRHA